MATLPSATTVVEDTAGAQAQGLDICCVISPCATSPDVTPRLFGSAKAVFEQHGYCEGVEYTAVHAQRTGKGVLFVGIPINTIGVIGREDKSGNSDTCVTTLAAGSDGVLAEHDGVLKVVSGGTIGTDQIVLDLSLDGGRNFKKVRLGTEDSYTIPYFNVTISFGAGDLTEGDTIHTWHGSAPLSDSDGWQAAREALAAQQKGFRSVVLCGDLQDGDEADDFAAEWEAYETENERFVYARASIKDRLPLAEMSHNVVRMTGNPSITFAEVGGTGDTITRATGSFLADGFAVGDTIIVSGATANSGHNNVTGVVANVTDLVLTMGTTDLDAETSANISIVGYPTLTFAEVGSTGDTITRNRGSWLADGFRAGDIITIDGTVSNDQTNAAGLATVTALTLTLDTDDLDAETIRTSEVTITAGQTKAAWMAAADAEFADIDDQPRIDLSAGRAWVRSPFSGWEQARPAGWFASWREYTHDLHIATYRKDDGPVDGDLKDSDGVLVQWDDRVDGEAGSAARFTTLRTWANGPQGAFIALSLTRANDDSLLSRTHNAAVVNLACTTTQLNTENAAIGQSVILNSDGTATKDSLSRIESRVNNALKLALLTNRGEGPRASKAKWSADPSTLFNVAEPEMVGVLDLLLNGTIHKVRTAVRIQSGG